jgi:3-mercaptopyruvate sulfurtransferase SseA
VFNPAAGDNAHDRYLAGHIPGAVFMDHAAMSDANSKLTYTIPDEKTLGEATGGLGISNDTPVVVRQNCLPGQLAPGGFCDMPGIETSGC